MIYFEVVRRKGGFRALCRSYENGKLLWWTEVYTRKSAALHAIDLMQSYAPGADVYDET